MMYFYTYCLNNPYKTLKEFFWEEPCGFRVTRALLMNKDYNPDDPESAILPDVTKCIQWYLRNNGNIEFEDFKDFIDRVCTCPKSTYPEPLFDRKDYDALEIRYLLNGEKYRIVFTKKILYPMYSVEEVESVSRRKILGADMSKDGEEDDIRYRVLKYMGPKYNFYGDLDFIQFRCNWIYPSDDENSDGILKIIDGFGKKHEYNLSEKTVIDWKVFSKGFSLDNFKDKSS